MIVRMKQQFLFGYELNAALAERLAGSLRCIRSLPDDLPANYYFGSWMTDQWLCQLYHSLGALVGSGPASLRLCPRHTCCSEAWKVYLPPWPYILGTQNDISVFKFGLRFFSQWKHCSGADLGLSQTHSLQWSLWGLTQEFTASTVLRLL